MCRTVSSVLGSGLCAVQMLVRLFMTVLLLVEDVARMILQTVYNFISFMLQTISLLPLCCTFLVTTRLKCFACGGGGPCPLRSGGSDCLMSLLAIALLVYVFRATGVLDKIFYAFGYVKVKLAELPRAIMEMMPDEVPEVTTEVES